LIKKKIEIDIARGRWDLDKPDQPSVKLQDFQSDYLKFGSTTKSSLTCKTDRRAFREFSRFIGNPSLDQITPEKIEEFKADYAKRVKPSTVNALLRHLKSAFSTAVEWGKIGENPFKKVKLLKTPQRPPNFLSEKEIKRLLESVEDARIRMVIEFILLTGMRKGEVFSLKWKDVDLERGAIWVRGKGDKTRMIPIGKRLAALLAALIEKIPYSSDEFLFPFLRERKKRNPRTSWLTKKFRRYADRAGLPHATLHTLRHTFASHLVMAGADLASVQQLLGHSTITTTMIYSHLKDEHLRKTIELIDYKLDRNGDILVTQARVRKTN